MTEKIALKTLTGLQVVVPDSINLITTYVLLEQGDWFEDEIRLVRQLLEPGQTAIDIGANYGLYTLSIAQAVGASGQVWAFEPASTTFALLAESVAANGFAHVVLDRRGLSSSPGCVRLSLNDNAELNEIVRDDAEHPNTESIEISSLDCLMAEYDWPAIDFVKIDAEGEEKNIIAGGKNFFSGNSPLVQYEIRAGKAVHLDLVESFRQIGYASYRLIPGLGILVPFLDKEVVDGFLLNLFCCKPDRAAQLAARGLLVLPEQLPARSPAHDVPRLLDRWNPDGRHHWRMALGNNNYARPLLSHWEATVARGGSKEIVQALALHAISHDAAVPATDRFIALRESFILLHALCRAKPGYLRLANLARVAIEFGARVEATKVLGRLFDQIVSQRQFDPSEPFLAVTPRFDSVDPGERLGNWAIGSALEAFETAALYSSYYEGQGGRDRLQAIVAHGFASDEMHRRLALVNRRFPLPTPAASARQ